MGSISILDDTGQNEVGSVVLAGYWINPCSKSDKVVQKFAFKVYDNLKILCDCSLSLIFEFAAL